MILTQELVKSHFDYDPTTGNFYRHVRTGRENKDGSCGFVTISIQGRSFTKGQAAWVYMTGKLPPEGYVVSFKNKNREDFRFENLYLITNAGLRLGVGLPSRKSRLPIGVRMRLDVKKGRRCYIAGARINKRFYRIGTFTTPTAAGTAYKKAIEVYKKTGELLVHRKDIGKVLLQINS